MPSCDIFSGQGQKARYWFDRPALPASAFDPATMPCARTFVILKGIGADRISESFSVAPGEVPWFEWLVFRLADLPQRYCDQPQRVFEELNVRREP
jgi:hypothetical protein